MTSDKKRVVHQAIGKEACTAQTVSKERQLCKSSEERSMKER